MADVHGFKHKRTAQVLSDIANREQATRADLTAERGKPDVAQSRHYWVLPSETILAAADEFTPSMGDFYIYYLNRTLATPKLERWQFNGVDVKVEVSSYYRYELAAEVGPLLRAEEDTFGELSIRDLCGTFPVTMTQTGGVAGNATTQCSYTYTITRDGDNIALSFGLSHKSRSDVGAYIAATTGLATYVAGTLVILECDEAPDNDACTDQTEWVETADLADDSVTADKIANDAVGTDQIDDSVTLTTPNIGAATATTVNGLTITVT